MDIPMWFLHGESALFGEKMTFFQPECLLSRRKSPFLSFLGATKTKPYSFWTKKGGLTGATRTCIVVGWRLGAFGFPLLYKC